MGEKRNTKAAALAETKEAQKRKERKFRKKSECVECVFKRDLLLPPVSHFWIEISPPSTCVAQCVAS